MITVTKHLFLGFREGIRRRDSAFLTMLVVAPSIPLMVSFFTARAMGVEFNWANAASIGPLFFLTIVFSVYLVAIKALQVFHVCYGDSSEAPKLTRQVDVVVMAALFALLVSNL